MKKIKTLIYLSIIGLVASCSSNSDDTPADTFTTQLSTTNLTFTDTNVGNSSNLNFTVSNTGTGTININTITTPEGYSVSPTNTSIASGNEKEFTVTFTPTSFSTFTGDLIITSNSTSTANKIALSGKGTEGDNTSITYYGNVKPIISQNCSTSACHSAGSKAGGVDLSTYALVKLDFQDNSAFGSMAQIRSGAMPRGRAKLSAATIDLLQSWIDNGFEEGTPN